ncbi:MAG: XdhC family protein [Oxalicibacterium faecigallinarum]|uniref:XdhC family protein n=1 Tax=Oxalicibacterium faecigallinarum TaxID=573741 RepID=UPI002808A53C|nr:XdhC family protein [Oxalicibacterium faecigallinarum]MDQ7969682.1 XdhC family protein [Oxalicibacterium faecigallinarum]
MDSIDIAVLRTLRDWRTAGRQAMLATVTKTWGSSPRPVGAMMALCEDGLVSGSVSGGCIEDDLIRRYASPDSFASNVGTRVVRYGIDAEEAHRFGLPCGGTLELLLEFNPEAASLDQLVQELDAGNLMQRTVNNDGQMTLEKVNAITPLSFDGQRLTIGFGPQYRMLLIGAGPLAAYLSTMALFNGFAVTVCDPRVEQLDALTVAGIQKTSAMPDDAVVQFSPDKSSCIVALSHDPKLDDLALLEALHSQAFYIGAIGSRRSSNNRRERMMTHFAETEASLQRLHSPVGIYIGSKTPAEIAVSIMAEIIAFKNGVQPLHPAIRPEILATA